MIDIDHLSDLIASPETHRKVLCGYSGAYSLGVGHVPGHGQRPVLILHVEAVGEREFPAQVRLAGEAVPLVVQGGFQAPKAVRPRIRI